jgi:phosphoglycolate phosphatase-like HAD superfamily hydrolase
MGSSASLWQAVFFDFDGVIADSNQLKADAFAALFAPYGTEAQEAVVRYHLENGGMPRQQKLRHCFAAFAKQILTDSELHLVSQEFSTLVLDKVVAAPLLPGALAALQQLRHAATPAFVISGTPADEMRLIVAHKGLDGYFKEVHGSPLSKVDILADLLVRYGFISDRCLFIGDALTDYRAALATRLAFLGIVSQERNNRFPEDVPTSPEITLVF